MIQGLLTALGTTAGKVGAGVALTAAATGGAIASDSIDVPIIEDTPSEEVVVDDTDVVFESITDEILGEPESSAVEVAEDENDIEAVESEPEGEEEESESEDGNHGAAVSELARSTELEGCEKGQAVSALASSKAADKRKNPEKDHDPCGDGGEDGESDGGEEVVTEEAVAAESTDSDAESEESDESDETEDADASEKRGNGKGPKDKGKNE